MIIDIISLRVIVESDINNRLHRSVYGINIENDDKNEEHNPTTIISIIIILILLIITITIIIIT